MEDRDEHPPPRPRPDGDRDPRASARGEIIGSTPAAIDFTDAAEAGRQANWSHPEVFKVDADGLGWGVAGDQGTRDFWLRTGPIGVGLSWRPTSIATIRATVEAPGVPGMLFARYSADAEHWTTWQLLEAAEPSATGSSRGTLRVPACDRSRYDGLRLAYARREDVPWRFDEEALAADILRREPAFFAAARRSSATSSSSTRPSCRPAGGSRA